MEFFRVFLRIFQFVMGMYTGILIMAAISGFIINRILKRSANNEKIHNISKKSFDIFTKNKKIKTKIFNSLRNEIVQCAKLANPDSNAPLLDLSFNEMIGGVNNIQFRLRTLVDYPLLRPLKGLTITQILSVEEVVKKPIKVYNSKPVKVLMKIWSYVMTVINILSPVLWVRRILKHTVFKEGKKTAGIIAFDYIGNLTYDIYNHKVKEVKDIVNEVNKNVNENNHKSNKNRYNHSNWFTYK